MVWKTSEGTGTCKMIDMTNNENRQDMRVVVAGHVDHGKSTILGRLLADTGSLPQGKLEQIREKCRRNAKPFEYAFLLDALKDEQAQGVTIDSARCFFKTKKRNYIMIDVPGHTEFIKNMVTGASRAEAALLVIDAIEGVRDNSRRHGLYLSLLGIEKICVLVNKMDLADYGEARFNEIARRYSEFLHEINVEPLSFIPVSGFLGDNIVRRSENMKWYGGKTALETLESFSTEESPSAKPFRMPVQDVYKFTEDGDQRRIIAGTLESGRLGCGEEVVFHPSGKKSRVKSIEAFGAAETDEVLAGFSTGFTLADQIYIKRGELACKVGEPEPFVANRVRATMFWLGKEPVKTGNSFLLKTGTAKTIAKIVMINRVWDASTPGFQSKDQIDRHEIADCVISFEKAIAFDTVALFPAAGRFVLVDGYTISGGGIIQEAMRPDADSASVSAADGKVGYDERCRAMGQRGLVLWFTGLSGAGKSTIAIELERKLMNRGVLAYRLDGDNIRDGLNSDLGFSMDDRVENIRRISEVARLFKDSGMISLVSFISPLRSMRDSARNIVGEAAFLEVYVKASLETCIARDVKGLYSKAMAGLIKDFTGISSPYEEPDCPDIVLDTEAKGVSDCVDSILDFLESRDLIAKSLE